MFRYSESDKGAVWVVGVGRDGAAANIAADGLKGLVEKEIEWIYCLALD